MIVDCDVIDSRVVLDINCFTRNLCFATVWAECSDSVPWLIV